MHDSDGHSYIYLLNHKERINKIKIRKENKLKLYKIYKINQLWEWLGKQLDKNWKYLGNSRRGGDIG